MLGALVVWLNCFGTIPAEAAIDPLDKQIVGGWDYKSFDEALQQIEHKTDFKVVCPKELEDFMQTVWMKTSFIGDPAAKITVREYLDQICGQLSLKWKFEPKGSVLAVEPVWKISDPRGPAELLKAVWQPGYSADYEKDAKWQTAFNALLSHEINFDKAWKVRQKSVFQRLLFGAREASKPILMKEIIAASGVKYVLVVICQEIQMYPGQGSVSYYWFEEDGTLAGAGLMSSGWRCKVVDTTIDNEFGANSDKTQEFQMILKSNMRDFMIARFVLGNSGLELTHLTDAHGEKVNNDGCDVGRSLMEPDKQ